MNQHRSIRQFWAGILLIVFSLTATPKSLLHDFFSRHADAPCTVNHSTDTTLTSFQYHCGFVNVAVGTPFTLEDRQWDPVVRVFAVTYLNQQVPFYAKPATDEARHRGPPVFV